MSEQTNELSAEQIMQNWERYKALCTKLGDRSEPTLKMLDTLGERLAMCPASSRAHFHLAVPGGLVDHSLRVYLNARRLVKAYDWDLPADSLIIGALFHDLGKIGDDQHDNYVPQADNYRRTKYGENYTSNPSLPYMSVPLRGIWLLQHFGVRLTQPETLAIYLNDGFLVEQNKEYCLKEPLLAHVIMTADYQATMQEKLRF